MKQYLLLALAAIAGPLAAEQFENVEFQFPPSNNEWRLLTDKLDGDGEYHISVYTHREGDALELFVACRVHSTSPDEEEETEEESLNFLKEMLGLSFPNHSYVDNELEESGIHEWEWTDGAQDIAHGFTRAIEDSNKSIAFGYFTTAPKHEANKFLWTGVLNKLVVVDQHQLTE